MDSESTGASFPSSAIKTSNSLSSSSAVLTFGRVGRVTFDLGAIPPLADRGALVRTGPVLYENNVTMHYGNQETVHTSSPASCLPRFQGAQQGKVARSCSTAKQSKCQAYLQTAHVEAEQYRRLFPLVVLKINVNTSNPSTRPTPSPRPQHGKEHKPFASLPSNSFLARVASAGFSYVMMATPEERPLRSYFKAKGHVSGLACCSLPLKSQKRKRSSKPRLFNHSKGTTTEVTRRDDVTVCIRIRNHRTLISGSRTSVPICPKMDF